MIYDLHDRSRIERKVEKMIDPSAIILSAVAAIILIIFAWYAISLFRKKPVTGAESLVDAKGVVYTERLAPDGEVSISGVIWKAHVANPKASGLKKGDPITVKKVEELTLIVESSRATVGTRQAS
jgi:membrane-bound ClpP family serine protease